MKKKGDITITAESVDEKSLVRVAYALGYDIYINSKNYKTEYEQLGKLLVGFTSRHKVSLLEMQLKNQKTFLKTKK